MKNVAVTLQTELDEVLDGFAAERDARETAEHKNKELTKEALLAQRECQRVTGEWRSHRKGLACKQMRGLVAQQERLPVRRAMHLFSMNWKLDDTRELITINEAAAAEWSAELEAKVARMSQQLTGNDSAFLGRNTELESKVVELTQQLKRGDSAAALRGVELEAQVAELAQQLAHADGLNEGLARAEAEVIRVEGLNVDLKAQLDAQSVLREGEKLLANRRELQEASAKRAQRELEMQLDAALEAAVGEAAVREDLEMQVETLKELHVDAQVRCSI